MLHNAATYIFGGFSGVVAIGLATWQVGKHFSEGLASLQPEGLASLQPAGLASLP